MDQMIEKAKLKEAAMLKNPNFAQRRKFWNQFNHPVILSFPNINYIRGCFHLEGNQVCNGFEFTSPQANSAVE
jgi:hypothetical protein